MNAIYMDIPRFYTALAEWFSCIVYFFIFRKRLSGIKNYIVCMAALLIQAAYLVFTGNLDTFFWVPCMLMAAAMMYAFLYYGLQASALAICFICAKAFLFAEFMASLEWQIHVFLFPKSIDVYHWKQLLFMAAVYACGFLLMYYMEKIRRTEEFVESITKKECISVISVVVISFAVSNLSFVFSNTPFTSRIQTDIFTIRTLVDLCGIAIMFFLQSQIQELLAEKELTAIHSALKSQYDQYRTYQESFEMMNIKYHDLKHQIAGMRVELDAGKREQWLDEMEKSIEILGETGHTGSSVLDGILAGKSLYCKKNNIKITCVADGSILQGIHVTDLCTIFGNALDNAIESVSVVEQEEKRLIHLAVSREKNFIYIKLENYCENKLEIGRNQMPQTNKENRREHGYGMRSMKQSVEKYHGTMAYGLKSNWFELKILIPYHE